MAELSTNQILEGLEQYGATVSRTGSREIVSPPPEGSDDDYLVEAGQSNVLEIGNFLTELGFQQEGNQRYSGQDGFFYSWRKGDLNLLVTVDHAWATQHRLATIVARKLNLKDKADRVAVFAHYLYNKPRPEFLK